MVAAQVGREPGQFGRLSTADVTILGRYIFGAQWQTALGVELSISRRQIVYWATGQRQVSRKYSSLIAQIAGSRHRRRVERSRSRYRAMVASLNSESARLLLAEMLSDEIAVRSEALVLIARNTAPNHSADAARYA